MHVLGQKLTSVSLWRMTDDGAKDTLLLWRIAGEGPAGRMTSVAAGEVPEGFTETTSLTDPIPANGYLDFVVRFGQPEASNVFRVTDLRSANLFVDPAWYGNSRHVSFERFERENRQDCAAT